MNITQNSMLTSDRLALLLPAPPLETDWPFPGRVHWVSVPGPCVWNEKRNGWRASQRFESSSQPAPHTGTLAPVYTTAAATQTENKQHRKLWDEMTDKKCIIWSNVPAILENDAHASKRSFDLWHSRIVLLKFNPGICNWIQPGFNFLFWPREWLTANIFISSSCCSFSAWDWPSLSIS